MELPTYIYLVLGVLGFVAGLVIGSLAGAIWLRLAAKMLSFPNIDYMTAFRSVLIVNFVVLILNLSVGWNWGFSQALAKFGEDQPRFARMQEISFSFPPTFHLYALAFSLVISAAIFCRTLSSKDTFPALSFRDSFALTACYGAISVACVIVLSAIAFAIAALLSAAG